MEGEMVFRCRGYVIDVGIDELELRLVFLMMRVRLRLVCDPRVLLGAFSLFC